MDREQVYLDLVDDLAVIKEHLERIGKIGQQIAHRMDQPEADLQHYKRATQWARVVLVNATWELNQRLGM